MMGLLHSVGWLVAVGGGLGLALSLVGADALLPGLAPYGITPWMWGIAAAAGAVTAMMTRRAKD